MNLAEKMLEISKTKKAADVSAEMATARFMWEEIIVPRLQIAAREGKGLKTFLLGDTGRLVEGELRAIARENGFGLNGFFEDGGFAVHWDHLNRP